MSSERMAFILEWHATRKVELVSALRVNMQSDYRQVC